VQIVYKKGQLHQFESHFVAQQHFEKGEGVWVFSEGIVWALHIGLTDFVSNSCIDAKWYTFIGLEHWPQQAADLKA
jgi:hypothetical protein